MGIELPARGFVFWPVGCGDSTTVKVNDNVFMQVDIHHLGLADDDDEPYNAVVDSLMNVLPEVDGAKYLAVFALSHADEDHCKGFKLLQEKVNGGDLRIGELWFTPRVIRDHEEEADLCDDAAAFVEEALRRVAVVCSSGENTSSGDRVRVIGSDDILDEDRYKDLPDRFKSRPGDEVTVLDGVHFDGEFRAFLHSPFGDDSAGERNATSLGMQITLREGDTEGRVMLLGDLDYPRLKRIFIEFSDEPDKAWDVLLAPHHCSKSALFVKNENDVYVLQDDIVEALTKTGGDIGWIVASANPIPARNAEGDNPPHAIAKQQYEAIAPSGFLCTGEHPDENSDDPIVFSVDTDGISLVGGGTEGASLAAAAVTKARGGAAPHGQKVGFG